MRNSAIYSVVCALFLCLVGLPARARENLSEIDATRVAQPIVLDGKLNEWQRDRFIKSFFEEALLPNYEIAVGLRYDATALYVGLHVADTTPLHNAHTPTTDPDEGIAGDCLQLSLFSGPTTVFEKLGADSTDTRICHLTFWYDTAGKRPVVVYTYGMDRHGRQMFTGRDADAVFTIDPNGKGYILEARILWSRLHGKAPLPGSCWPFTLQPSWGDNRGMHAVVSYAEIVQLNRYNSFATPLWGQVNFTLTTIAPLRVNPAYSGDATGMNPLRLKVPLVDPQARIVSLGIFAEGRGLVRTLPVTVRPDSLLGQKEVTVAWDGRDDSGQPLAPSMYTVKWLTHRGIGQQFVASLNNAGTPPWLTDDGHGAWGGDWAPPLAAASVGDVVYLGWAFCEAGTAIICVDRHLGDNGQATKRWGIHPRVFNDVGMLTVALAATNDTIFVGQDGPFMNDHSKAAAAVSLYEPTSGRPINFPSGKPTLTLSHWDPTTATADGDAPIFQRKPTGDFGPQQVQTNLIDLAVKGDVLYASLYRENKVVAVNWKTGVTVQEFPMPHPAGLEIDAVGRLLAATPEGIVRIDLASGQRTILGAGQLLHPWGLALDAAGNLYVSECGRDMQVKVFTADGALLRTIGKRGGRAWIGAYDSQGMLMPAGIAVDGDGKLWVTEYDEFPRRVSVWGADGKVVADFHGPCVPQTDRAVDPEHPELINAQMVEYKLDYATGKYTCVATLWRPHVDGWTPVTNFARNNHIQIRHRNGQTYGFVGSWFYGIVLKQKGDHFQACALYGLRPALPIKSFGDESTSFGRMTEPEKFFTPQQLAILHEGGQWTDVNLQGNVWLDRNDDGIIQPEELTVERRTVQGMSFITGIDADMALLGIGWNNSTSYRVPVDHFTDTGVPVYPPLPQAKPLLHLSGSSTYAPWIDATRQQIYTIEYKGGDSRRRGEWAAVVGYTPQGQVQWMYRNCWLEFCDDSPFASPGNLVGISKIIGCADVTAQTGVLMLPGYYGNYHMLSTDGLWVAAFCQDNRLGGAAGPNTIFIENFTGSFFRNKDNGKYYLIGGDIDARVWEITGLDTLKTGAFTVTLTAADTRQAQAMATIATPLKPLAPLALERAPVITIDGALEEWTKLPTASVNAGPGRGAKVALAYDARNLYASFTVDDRSPLINTQGDALLLFKGGDTCEVMLATDPAADPQRKTPVRGDTRLLFSVLNGQPVCVLYQAVSATGALAPKTFISPTGKAEFQRVEVVATAKVAVTRTDTGYILEAAVPLAAIGFTPTPGMTTRGDVGVLFGTDGGGRTILRAYYANTDTATIEDVPSEARLTPAQWTTLEVK